MIGIAAVTDETMNQSMCDIDFGRTFLRFTSTRVEHTPRLRIDAVCTLTPATGPARTYFLTCTCVGERMYAATDLIHDPVSEFNLVAEPGVEFLMIKRHACAEHDVISAHRLGETMPTHDGKGAAVVELDVTVARHNRMTRVDGYRTFRDALFANRPVNGRTTYTDDDGSTRVVMEYPAGTVNVAHDREAWQVDAGPVLMPVRGGPCRLDVERFGQAFLVYNRWDYAETVSRGAAGAAGGSPGQTRFYNLRRNLHCCNELFSSAPDPGHAKQGAIAK